MHGITKARMASCRVHVVPVGLGVAATALAVEQQVAVVLWRREFIGDSHSLSRQVLHCQVCRMVVTSRGTFQRVTCGGSLSSGV